MFCSKCGEKIEEGTKFCIKCGTHVNASPVPNTSPTTGAFGGVTSEQTSANTLVPTEYVTSIVQQQPVILQSKILTEKNNIVFNTFAIFFIVIGVILYIYNYWGGEDYIRGLAYSGSFYEAYSLIATVVISIGILFSIISLHRKQNKMFFLFCVSYCIFLALWNFFILLTVMH
jgi:hypothetical protein